MILKDIGIGRLVVTDVPFDSVDVDDSTFTARLGNFGIFADRVCWMHQTHSDHVRVVDQACVLDDTDSIITRTDGLLLVTRTADCVPLLMWDEVTGTVAVTHAGRAGFLSGVVQSTLAKLVDLGGDPCNLRCFLGPHLRVDHHEVGPEIADQVGTALEDTVLVTRDGLTFFDLTAGVIKVLTMAGVRPEQVEDCGLDTYADSNFFSYRRMIQKNDPLAKTNRFASGILLKS